MVRDLHPPLVQAIFPQYKYPQAKSRYAEIASHLNLSGSSEDEKVCRVSSSLVDLCYQNTHHNFVDEFISCNICELMQVLKLIEHIEKLKASVGIPGSIAEIMGAEKKEVIFLSLTIRLPALELVHKL